MIDIRLQIPRRTSAPQSLHRRNARGKTPTHQLAANLTPLGSQATALTPRNHQAAQPIQARRRRKRCPTLTRLLAAAAVVGGRRIPVLVSPNLVCSLRPLRCSIWDPKKRFPHARGRSVDVRPLRRPSPYPFRGLAFAGGRGPGSPGSYPKARPPPQTLGRLHYQPAVQSVTKLVLVIRAQTSSLRALRCSVWDTTGSFPSPPRKHQAAPLPQTRGRRIPAAAPRFRDRPPPCSPPPQIGVSLATGRRSHALSLDLPPWPPIPRLNVREPPPRGVTRNLTPPNGAELQRTAALCSHRSLLIRRGQPARRLPRLPSFKVSIGRHAACGPRLACHARQPAWLAPESPPMPPTAGTPSVPLEAAQRARGRLHPLEKRNDWCSLPRGWRLQPAPLAPQLTLIRVPGLDAASTNR